MSSLAETAIYVATVDKFSDVLKTILAWVAENREEVADIKMDNADCILHASLEDDKDQVRTNLVLCSYTKKYIYACRFAFSIRLDFACALTPLED